MLHLELFHHWMDSLHQTFSLGRGELMGYANAYTKHGLEHQFLMRHLLATSALSLSILNVEQRAYYHQHANRLQSQALAEFNAVVQHLDQHNIVAAFLASSLIGLHVFCETFTFRGDNFNDTLDNLVSCMNLLRGVRSIIDGWWNFLLASDLGSMLRTAHDVRVESKGGVNHLYELKALIENADLGPATRKTYEQSLEELGFLVASQNKLSDPAESPSANAIFSWLVISPKEYVELLSARRPEALILLAYYAAILHRRRKFWAVGDAGEFLINAIGAYLGKHWDEWLVWPRSVIAS